jgi:hypothetical protein
LSNALELAQLLCGALVQTAVFINYIALITIRDIGDPLQAINLFFYAMPQT